MNKQNNSELTEGLFVIATEARLEMVTVATEMADAACLSNNTVKI